MDYITDALPDLKVIQEKLEKAAETLVDLSALSKPESKFWRLSTTRAWAQFTFNIGLCQGQIEAIISQLEKMADNDTKSVS